VHGTLGGCMAHWVGAWHTGWVHGTLGGCMAHWVGAWHTHPRPVVPPVALRRRLEQRRLQRGDAAALLGEMVQTQRS
jgi:hypothetical protein